jgi:hypothetical protein
VTALEVALERPLAPYGIEQLRTRFLFSVVGSRNAREGAVVAAQMAFETEIGVILVKMTAPSPSIPGTVVASRRRFLDVDLDLRANRFLFEPALDDLRGLGAPEPYVGLLRRHLSGDYPRYRVCATAAILSLAAALS